MKLGIIGLGNMGSAIAVSLKKSNQYELYFYEKQSKNTKQSTIAGLNPTYSIQELSQKVDYLLLCTKPDQYKIICEQINYPVNVISILAGIEFEKLKQSLPPESHVVRVMPNIALLVEKSVSAIYGDKELYDVTKSIFSNLGLVFEVKKESIIDVVIGLSGSGIAYVSDFIDHLSLSGVYNGLSYQESLSIVLETMQGCVDLLKKSDLDPSQLRNKISSPGGTTIEGLKKLKENRFGYSVMEAVKASVEKSKNGIK